MTIRMNRVSVRAGGRFPWQPRSAALGPILLALLLSAACGRGSRPLPPPPPPPEVPQDRGPTVPDPSQPRPELEVFLEPQVIAAGDSALLTWDSRNADRITIDHGIGSLGVEGRIRLFPESTTTYRIQAEGPGGTNLRTVTVEVREGPEALDEPSLDDLPLEEQFKRAIKPVYFGFGSAELTGEARLTLDGNLRWLLDEKQQQLHLEIQGHCDSRGSEEFNLALGDRRAQAVRSYLLDNGMSPSRLVAYSLGEEQPAVSGDSEEAHALNRRVQFRLIDR